MIKTLILPSSFERPTTGLRWVPSKPLRGLESRGGLGWQSCGGTHKNHLCKTLPQSLELDIPQGQGNLIRIHIAGIFALWADEQLEVEGSLGAILCLSKNSELVHRQDFVLGRHYHNPTHFPSGCRLNGDGSSFEMVDILRTEEKEYRVDLCTIDLPSSMEPDKMVFSVLSQHASFVIFDVIYEFGGKRTCPFRSESLGVSLAELVSVIRAGDRARFAKAQTQLEQGIKQFEDELDEARSMVLTFLAVVSAALLELDAPRGLHRLQLDTARKLDTLCSIEEITQETRRILNQITSHVFPDKEASGSPLIDKALGYIDKCFARDLTDKDVADYVGLSTSHFRYLFKMVTGKPFHQYLLAIRLDRARLMLLQSEMSIAEIASSVGFHNSGHFCRAFTKRFSVSPSSVRIIQIPENNKNGCPFHVKNRE